MNTRNSFINIEHYTYVLHTYIQYIIYTRILIKNSLECPVFNYNHSLRIFPFARLLHSYCSSIMKLIIFKLLMKILLSQVQLFRICFADIFIILNLNFYYEYLSISQGLDENKIYFHVAITDEYMSVRILLN